MQVIQIGQVKDMLAHWEAVRACILTGRVSGFSTCLRDDDGGETIFLGGHYRVNTKDAARVGMRMSWERTKEEDASQLEHTGT